MPFLIIIPATEFTNNIPFIWFNYVPTCRNGDSGSLCWKMKQVTYLLYIFKPLTVLRNVWIWITVKQWLYLAHYRSEPLLLLVKILIQGEGAIIRERGFKRVINLSIQERCGWAPERASNNPLLRPFPHFSNWVSYTRKIPIHEKRCPPLYRFPLM